MEDYAHNIFMSTRTTDQIRFCWTQATNKIVLYPIHSLLHPHSPWLQGSILVRFAWSRRQALPPICFHLSSGHVMSPPSSPAPFQSIKHCIHGERGWITPMATKHNTYIWGLWSPTHGIWGIPGSIWGHQTGDCIRKWWCIVSAGRWHRRNMHRLGYSESSVFFIHDFGFLHPPR